MPETQGTLATPEELTTWWVDHFKTGPLAREKVTVAEAMDALQEHWAIRWKEGERWTTMPVSRDTLHQVLDVDGTGQTGPDHEQITRRLCEHMAFLNYHRADPERQEDAHILHNDDGSALRITAYTSADTTRHSALLRLIDHEGKPSRPTIVGPTGAAFIASHMLLSAHGPDMVDPASVPALHLTHDQVRQTIRQAADQAQSGDSDEATELVADAVWDLVAPHLAAAGLGEVVDTAKMLRDLQQARIDLHQTQISLEVAQSEYENLRHTHRPVGDPPQDSPRTDLDHRITLLEEQYKDLAELTQGHSQDLAHLKQAPQEPRVESPGCSLVWHCSTPEVHPPHRWKRNDEIVRCMGSY